MKHKMFLFLALAVFSIGCKEEVLPKPKAMLRLEYPTRTACPISRKTRIVPLCWTIP